MGASLATVPVLVKKVLIVSPHFPPINAPDMQRVRLALPYLRELGWEPTVIAVGPDLVEGGVRDPLLAPYHLDRPALK